MLRFNGSSFSAAACAIAVVVVLVFPGAVSGASDQSKIVSFSGRGNSDSSSFDLPPGKVRLVARTWGGTLGTYSAISLKSEDGSYLSGAELSIITKGAEEGRGDTTVRGLAGGEYYIHVISGVNWEATVYRVD